MPSFSGRLLEYGKEQGAIDPAIDMKIVAKMLTGMTFSLTDFISKTGKLIWMIWR